MRSVYLTLVLLIISCGTSLLKAQEEYRAALPSVMPISPNAASIAQYVDYPVSHYTGIPQINIPLYEADIYGYKLPISLNYHASGIKVSQEASWVGLGWSLNVSGSISRIIKGTDDLCTIYKDGSFRKGYWKGPEIAGKDIMPPIEPIYISDFYDCRGSAVRLIADTEPDIFYYSFPGGSGKFIIDKSRGPLLFEKSNNVKIEIKNLFSNHQELWYFTITTPDGTVYVFDKEEKTTTFFDNWHLNKNSTLVNRIEDRSIIGSNSEDFISGWTLTKIILSNKKEIKFSYVDEKITSPAQESLRTYYNPDGSLKNIHTPTTPLEEGCSYAMGSRYSTSKSKYDSPRLSKIEWDFGHIDFIPLYREDLNGTADALYSINIYKKSNELLKIIEFDYSYFNQSYSGLEKYKYIYQRLRLDRVSDKGRHIGSLFKQEYKFSYFEGNLPAKNSKNTDYWGYNNGGNYGDNYCAKQLLDPHTVLPGAVKTSNLKYLKIGTLNKITYPTGGCSVYEFEENTFEKSNWNPVPPTIPSEIKDYLEVYNFYSNDSFEGPPSDSFTFEIKDERDVVFKAYIENSGCEIDPTFSYEAAGSPIGLLTNLDNSNFKKRIWMPLVFEEKYGGVGCEYNNTYASYNLPPGRYKFEACKPPRDVYVAWTITGASEAAPDTTDYRKGGGLRIKRIITDNKTREFSYKGGKLLVEPTLTILDRVCPGGGRFRPYNCIVQLSEPKLSFNSFSNGNVIGYDEVEEYLTDGINNSKTHYEFYNEPEQDVNVESGLPLPTIPNYYNGLHKSITHLTNNVVVEQTDYKYRSTKSQRVEAFYWDPVTFSAYSYHYQIEWIQKKQEVVHRPMSDKKIEIRSTYEFSYNNDFQLASSNLINDLKELKGEIIYYITDFSDNISIAMKNAYLVGIPIEKLSLRNGQVIAGKKTDYKEINNMFLPSIVSTLDMDTPTTIGDHRNYYKPKLYFDIYNDYGKPIQLRNNDIFIVYLWSYNSAYPVAEIKGATYDRVKSVLTESVINRLSTSIEPSESDLKKLNDLRSNVSLGNIMVTTYTYKPLVGMTSATDPSGKTTYYEYDGFNQLKRTYIKERSSDNIEVERTIQAYEYYYNN